MADTTGETSPFRHDRPLSWLVVIATLVFGIVLRALACSGELWLDELWSLLNVGNTRKPIEILTVLKHDNNHLLNTAWMWLLGPFQPALIYRLPSLLWSALLLFVLMGEWKRSSDRSIALVWFILTAFSYPIILYSTEARGYSLALLMTLIAYRALTQFLVSPREIRPLVIFSAASMVGCLSHAIYALFLAPAIVWMGYCVATSPERLSGRRMVRIAAVPPVLLAIALTFGFYRGMEIGGAPLLPYLEVASSTISVSFGGEPLSATNPSVTGWSLFLATFVVIVSLFELTKWLASKDPLAVLVGLILVTPWLAVVCLQPHFILPRYFLIQLVFAYLLMARFLVRLGRQGSLGTALASIIVLLFTLSNSRHTYQLFTLGRSHFKEIFHDVAAKRSSTELPTIGGDQDFQNSLRLRYAEARPESPSVLGFARKPFYPRVSLTYVEDYRESASPPQYVIRETLDAFDEFPRTFTLPSGATYTLLSTYRAPPLSGSHVALYERASE